MLKRRKKERIRKVRQKKEFVNGKPIVKMLKRRRKKEKTNRKERKKERVNP